ncbi:MAG: hypothetical protein JWN30_694 [Bacilli bacterium]|nr:hypothetical protein [Bacilli bacterium]
MAGPKLITNQIIREYDFVGNAWEHVDIFFRMHASCLHSGFLTTISPVQLHTLVTLSLFMQENGRIEVSLSEFARGIGISTEQARRRIDSLSEFVFRDQPVVHIEEIKHHQLPDNDCLFQVTLVPLLSSFYSYREDEHADPFQAEDDQETVELLTEPLLPFLLDRLGANLTEADLQFVADLQLYPCELPPAVIEVLIDYVISTRNRFDRNYAQTLAYSWSTACIQTKEQALKWIEETQMAMKGTDELMQSAAAAEHPTEGYLLNYLRERLKREPSAVQKEMIYSLQKPPYQFDAGLIEVLIDYVISQMVVRNGKPDFPKRYVETIVHDWFEKQIHTRETALQELAKWRENFSLGTPPVLATSRTEEQPRTSSPSSSNSRKKSGDSGVAAYINRLKKAGL